MVEELKTSESVIVTVSHDNLIAPIAGFAMEGISEYGTKGLLVFLPTSSPNALIDLIKIERD